MKVIEICVGSSCFLRGAGGVIKAFNELIEHSGLEAVIELKGRFCLEHCTEGVTVVVNDRIFKRVKAESVPELFNDNIISVIREGEKHSEPNHYQQG